MLVMLHSDEHEYSATAAIGDASAAEYYGRNIARSSDGGAGKQEHGNGPKRVAAVSKTSHDE